MLVFEFLFMFFVRVKEMKCIENENKIYRNEIFWFVKRRVKREV